MEWRKWVGVLMPDISFEAFCEKCGVGICNNISVESGYRGVKISIQPCEICLEEAREEGREEIREEQE